MFHGRKHAAVNVKALIVVIVLAVIVVGGGAAAYTIRQSYTARQAKGAGLAAYERRAWTEAARNLNRYLERYPDAEGDAEIWRKFGRAHLSVRPLGQGNILRAIQAFREVFRLNPDDENAYTELAALYTAVRNFDELKYIAEQRKQRKGDDLLTEMWLANALAGLRKWDEAVKKLHDDIVPILDNADEATREKYIDAYLLLARIAVEPGARLPADEDEQYWLNRAVDQAPKSAEARVRLARYKRLHPPSETNRDLVLAEVRQDLELASGMLPESPRVRLLLSQEFAELGDYRRAREELDAVEKLDAATLEKHFFVVEDWTILKFVQLVDLALRQGTPQEAVPLAEALLSENGAQRLEGPLQRLLVLPTAIELYARAADSNKAKIYLDEYTKLASRAGDERQLRETIDLLQAMVLRVQGRPYEIIKVLQPHLGRNVDRPRVISLLAEAYIATGQSRRAIEALTQYLTFARSDREMLMQLVREYMKAQYWDQAYRTAKTITKDSSQNIAVELLLAEVTVRGAAYSSLVRKEVDLRAVSDELERLKQKEPRRVEIRALQAMVADQQNDPATAEKILREAIDECSEPLQARSMLADLLMDQQRVEDALDVARKSTEEHADSPQAWLNLAAILERLDPQNARPQDARQALRDGLAALEKVAGEQRVEKRQLGIRLALFDLAHENKDEGLARLRELAGIDSDDVLVRALLLNQLVPAAVETEAYAEAQDIVNKLVGPEGSQGPTWRVYQAKLWLTAADWRGHQNEIRSVLDPVITADPGNSEAILLLADMYGRISKSETMEQIYRQALAVNPVAFDIAERLLNILEGQERFAEMKELRQRLEENFPLNAAQRIGILARTREWSEAIEDLKTRISISQPKDRARLRVLKARLLYQQDPTNSKEALDELKTALEEEPNLLVAAIARAAILRTQGRTDELLATLNEQVALDSKSFEARYWLAVFLANLGQLERAEEEYRKLTEEVGSPITFGVLGNFYHETGRPNEAIKTWEAGLAKHADNANLLRSLAPALFVRNRDQDRERAGRMLNVLRESVPNDPIVLWFDAQAKLEESQGKDKEEERKLIEEAKVTLRKITAIEPSAIEAYLELVRLALSENQLDAAREIATQANAANPKHPRVAMCLAQIDSLGGKHDLAAEWVRGIVLRDKDGKPLRDARNVAPALRFAEVAQNAAQKGYDEADQLCRDAIEYLDAALAVEPSAALAVEPSAALVVESNRDRLQWARTSMLHRLGDTRKAAADLGNFVRGREEQVDLELLLALADFQINLAEYAAAAQQIEIVERRAPRDPHALNLRVRLLARQQQFDAISELLRDFQPQTGADLGVLVGAAVQLSTAGREPYLTQAVNLLDNVAQSAPKSADVQLALALVLHKKGDVRGALECYKRVIDANPANWRAMNDQAWVLADTYKNDPDRLKEALSLVDRAVQLSSDSVSVHDTRARILVQLTRLDEAKREYSLCLTLAPRPGAPRARALVKLAELQLQMNERSEARQALEEAQAIDAAQNALSDEDRALLKELLGKTAPPAGGDAR